MPIRFCFHLTLATSTTVIRSRSQRLHLRDLAPATVSATGPAAALARAMVAATAQVTAATPVAATDAKVVAVLVAAAVAMIPIRFTAARTFLRKPRYCRSQSLHTLKMHARTKLPEQLCCVLCSQRAGQ